MLRKLLSIIGLGKKDNFISVDIGTYSIKIAEFEVKNNEPILKKFGQCRTSENAIINGIISKKELLLTNFINLFNNIKPSSNKVYICLPYEVIIIGNFKLKESNLEENNINKQINEEIPYKIEDVYYNYYIVPENDSYRIYYIVAKKDIVDQYIKFFEELNYKVVNIDADFTAFHNITEFIYGESSKLIIDWGFSKVKLFFCDKLGPVYARELFLLGLKVLKENFQKKFNISSEEAEKLIVDPFSKTDYFEDVKNLYKNYVKEVLKEIDQSIEMVFQKYNLEIEKIVLVGGGARILKIEEIISQKLGKEVKKMDIRSKVKIDDNIDKDYFEIINTQGVSVVSLGIKDYI